jgi:hypothetical protein
MIDDLTLADILQLLRKWLRIGIQFLQGTSNNECFAA